MSPETAHGRGNATIHHGAEVVAVGFRVVSIQPHVLELVPEQSMQILEPHPTAIMRCGSGRQYEIENPGHFTAGEPVRVRLLRRVRDPDSG